MVRLRCALSGAGDPQRAVTDAAAVREFVVDHHGQLSPLSTREALKWLNRKERG
jgi:hypothetical protein